MITSVSRLQRECSTGSDMYSLLVVDSVGAALHDTVLVPDANAG